MANESLLITLLPDGTYHVKETEPPDENDPEPAIDQSVKTADEVSQLVEQWLSEEEDETDGGADEQSESDTGGPMPGDDAAPEPADPQAMKSAWTQEAAKRDPASGLRK